MELATLDKIQNPYHMLLKLRIVAARKRAKQWVRPLQIGSERSFGKMLSTFPGIDLCDCAVFKAGLHPGRGHSCKEIWKVITSLQQME